MRKIASNSNKKIVNKKIRAANFLSFYHLPNGLDFCICPGYKQEHYVFLFRMRVHKNLIINSSRPRAEQTVKLGPIDLMRRNGDSSKGSQTDKAETAGDVKEPIIIINQPKQAELQVQLELQQEVTIEELEGANPEAKDQEENDDDEDDGSTDWNDRISRIKGTTVGKLSPLGRAGKSQLSMFRAEGKDLKKLLSAEDLTIYKTDTIAIMIRKSGRLVDFLDGYDKLIREGYVLSHQEPVDTFFEIPIAGIKTRLGKLYFFHHRKYTTMDPPPDPQIRGGIDQKQVAAVLAQGTTS